MDVAVQSGTSSTADAEDEKSAKVIEAVNASKLPPPETAQSISMRRLVVFAFWAIVLFLGFPMWWKTTEVYRADLPIKAMNDWAGGKMCNPEFPVRIRVEADGLSLAETESLIGSVHKSLDGKDFPAHKLQLLRSEVLDERSAALVVRLTASRKLKGGPAAVITSHTNTLAVFYDKTTIPKSPQEQSELSVFIAAELQKLFAEERAMLASAIYPGYSSSSIKYVTPEILDGLMRRTTRAVKYAPSYHLTFSLVTPEFKPTSWEVDSVLGETLSPLLASLSSMANFTIDTQIQSYATFSPDTQPSYDEQQKSWILDRERLGGFINAAEWPLSPSIGVGPTINFLLYVASPSQAPLHINSSNTDSWIIPQWGGVSILNPEKNWKGDIVNVDHLTSKQLRPAFLTFSRQLLSLLGFPATPDNSLTLRLSTLTRQRAVTLLLSASSTLGSLARLTQQLPSISIPNPVADSVSTTLKHLHDACTSLNAGDFQTALDNARVAEWHAEQAFFDRSMVGQVYFPEEHKVAVYLPLLGPVAVPLLLSAIKEIQAYLRARKKAG